MTAVGNNSLGTRTNLQVGAKTYAYYSLEKASAQLGDISRLPFSMKVLLGKTVTRAAQR
jgi:aconitate hydratase